MVYIIFFGIYYLLEGPDALAFSFFLFDTNSLMKFFLNTLQNVDIYFLIYLYLN